MFGLFRKKTMDQDLVLAKGCNYSMNCNRTLLNNNILIVGSSGCGKTRTIVSPNIDKAKDNYVILDPKGNLYETHKQRLMDAGYKVKLLDFIHPEESSHYNFFSYIRTPMDVKSIAHTLIYATETVSSSDPYWQESAELLLTTLIGYIWEYGPEEEQNIDLIIQLLSALDIADDEIEPDRKNAVDMIFDEIEEKEGANWITNGYKMFRNNSSRTTRCIVNQVASAIAKFNTPEIINMLSKDEVALTKLGTRRTAIFVVVSDTDRSMDALSSIFFSQLIHVLCQEADEKYNGELPFAVRLILDDFATNMRIADFPKMISSFRSRRISCMLIVQAEAQLESMYGPNAKTIITNCDTYVYLGGSDIETAANVGARAGASMRDILYMPIGRVWVFRRGHSPVYTVLNKPFVKQESISEDDDEPIDEYYWEELAEEFGCLDEIDEMEDIEEVYE